MNIISQKMKVENKNNAYYYSDNPGGDGTKSNKYRKVQGHYHLSGKYRGAVHNVCNFKLKLP